MKLFKIANKKIPGQCNAMRCIRTDITSGWRHPMEQNLVDLCERHSSELEDYISNNEQTIHTTTDNNSDVEVIQEYLKEQNPKRADELKEKIGPLDKGVIPARSLESVLIDNLAVQSGAIQSRQETAEKINNIALAIEIEDRETRDKADQLVALVHNEEKAIKAEINAMYKPVKDAAKATKERLDSWFGPTLTFYTEAKQVLKDKLGIFLNTEKERENKLLEEGKHDEAKECLSEPSENVRTKKVREYAIKNEGKNLPLAILVPREDKNEEIVKLLPRELLRPNYDLIAALVKEHGNLLDIPDIEIIEYEDVQMKGKRS